MLVAAGWVIQDYKALNLGAARGIAVREVPLKSGHCDYLLLVDRVPVGPYEELLKHDKVNLDLFWLKDDSLEDSANLPDPDVLAREIAEDLEAALEQFATIAEDLKR